MTLDELSTCSVSDDLYEDAKGFLVDYGSCINVEGPGVVQAPPIWLTRSHDGSLAIPRT
jgi:hypothetical protein